MLPCLPVWGGDPTRWCHIQRNAPCRHCVPLPWHYRRLCGCGYRREGDLLAETLDLYLDWWMPRHTSGRRSWM